MITLVNVSTNAFSLDLGTNGAVMVGPMQTVPITIFSGDLVTTPDSHVWAPREGATISFDGPSSSMTIGIDEVGRLTGRFTEGLYWGSSMAAMLLAWYGVRWALGMVNDCGSASED
jgi:hypothetical protein